MATDRDRILQKTTGGLDVFTHYLGEDCKKKVFRNPFRTDSNPSCHLYYHDDELGGEGRFILKDFGDSTWKGDCFWLVAQICHLNLKTDFQEILRTIDKELELYILDDKPMGYHPVMKKVTQIDLPNESRISKFTPKYRNFNKFEKEYWASYGITLDVLDRYHVRCLSQCYFERTDGTGYTIYGNMEVPMFGYTFNEGTGIKTYRPHAEIGRFMYAGNLPNPYIFGMDQLEMENVKSYNIFVRDEFIKTTLFITGGEKDVMSLAARGFNAICMNSETAKLREGTLAKLLQRFGLIVFLYDSDDTGKRESALRAQECLNYGCTAKHLLSVPEMLKNFPVIYSVTLPLAGTKQEKDVSDFFKLGHTASELREIVIDSIINTKDEFVKTKY